MQKLPWKTITACFVAKYFVVFAWAPSTRSSSSLTSRHAKRCCCSFFPRVRGKEMVKPQIKTWKSSSFELLNICTWEFKLLALKWFQIVPGKHRKRDVATVFAYSHVDTPIDQWECAYCLKYFIIRVFCISHWLNVSSRYLALHDVQDISPTDLCLLE